MADFFEEVDVMLKEILDSPVKADLYKHIETVVNRVKNPEEPCGSFMGVDIFESFMLTLGYKKVIKEVLDDDPTITLSINGEEKTFVVISDFNNPIDAGQLEVCLHIGSKDSEGHLINDGLSNPNLTAKFLAVVLPFQRQIGITLRQDFISLIEDSLVIPKFDLEVIYLKEINNDPSPRHICLKYKDFKEIFKVRSF